MTAIFVIVLDITRDKISLVTFKYFQYFMVIFAMTFTLFFTLLK